MVPVEVRRVDFDSRDAPGCDAQADDDPVEGVRVVAAGFPPVVPGAGVDEVARFADRGGGREEVGGGGEPFVGEGEDAGAEGRGDEVWDVLVRGVVRVGGQNWEGATWSGFFMGRRGWERVKAVNWATYQCTLT